jgi:hypothetical protein
MLQIGRAGARRVLWQEFGLSALANTDLNQAAIGGAMPEWVEVCRLPVEGRTAGVGGFC